MGDPQNRTVVTVACVIIASEKRRALLEKQILPSVVIQPFNEVVVVGDYRSGLGYRHLPFPRLTGTTVDAQFKRDIGTVATTSEWIVYLCDDHRLDADFAKNLRQAGLNEKGIGVPTRYTVRDTEIPLNMGDGYCGGHAGVFHRGAIQQVPWSVTPWHPNWDYIHSRMLLERGYELVELPTCRIEDIEGGMPWL